MIGRAIAAALPTLRAQAESLMVDSCTIERATGATWDEDEKKSVTSWSVIAADVRCHVEEPATSARTILTGQVVTHEGPVVKLPHTVGGIEPDDRLTVSGREPMWVTRTAHDDPSHPVERVVLCRWVR